MDKEKKKELIEKYLKPWDQKTHDEFMRYTGKTKEEHGAWHSENGGLHGSNKDEE